MTFLEKLQRQNEKGLFACAGLDPVEGKMPPGAWCDSLIRLAKAARGHAAARKPNIAFFLCVPNGFELYRDLCRAIKNEDPDAILIADMKVGDIGPTNVGYVKWAFEECWADAVTVHPYMGSLAMEPFLRDPDHGVFVLCRTSNKGAGQMQDVMTDEGIPYYQYVAKTVASKWNTNGNCGLVVGATYPDELSKIRGIVPELPLLIPGIGKQGGDLEATIRAAVQYSPCGPFVLNTSSDFMYQPTLEESVARLRAINDAARCIIIAG